MDSVQPGHGGGYAGAGRGPLALLRTSSVTSGKTPQLLSLLSAARGAWAVSGRAEPRTKDGNRSPIQAAFPS